ncbi:MAG: Na+/H+ antiporter NhaC family protein, partial [Myxococcota bacterium]
MARRSLFCTASLALLLAGLSTRPVLADEASEIAVDWPARRLWVGAKGVEGIRLTVVDPSGRPRRDLSGPLRVEGLTTTATVHQLSSGELSLPSGTLDAPVLKVTGLGLNATLPVPVLSGMMSLAPALVAIVLALLTRQVLLSLFGGVLLGASLIHQSGWSAFPRAIDFVVRALADADHMKIAVATMLMGGLIGVLAANGGTRGVVAIVATRARSVRSGSLATWAMGMVVFFDDYASSFVIGTTMRPVTDSLRISREKLSYLVDSTAAPISSLALISTWIGYEVSVMGDALQAAGIERDPYALFLEGLPSRFYPIYALVFVVFVAVQGRDFGPMLAAERRARHRGLLLREGAEPLMDASFVEESSRMEGVVPRAWLALLPLLFLIGGVVYVLVSTGYAAAAQDPSGFAEASGRGLSGWLGYIMANAASYDALVYGVATGCAGALAATLGVRALSLKDTMQSFTRGMQAMLMAVLVLSLAWAIGSVMKDLYAGPYVAQVVGGRLPAWSLGAIAFLLAGLMAFATGTSWGTIAILFPIVVPVAALHAESPGFDTLLLGTT